MAMLPVQTFFLAALFAAVATQSYLPANFVKCSASNKRCLKEQAQNFVPAFVKGIPELRTKALDPMPIGDVKFSLAGLNMDIQDGVHTGYSTVKIDDLSLDFKRNVLSIALHNDAQFVSKYQASGRLIILPIVGDGIFTADYKHMNLKLTIPFEVKKDNKDGKDRIAIKSFSLSHSVKGNENAKHKLTNLFNGNKQLAGTLENFIDNSGELLANELAKPILEVTVKVIFKQMRKLFDAVPLDDLVTRD